MECSRGERFETVLETGPHVPPGRGVYRGMKVKYSFEQAVRWHGETVLRVCRGVLATSADAEDAWSETFLAALRAWPDMADDTNVEAWLVRVAQRKTIDIIRAQTRHAIPTDEIPELPTRVGNPGSECGLWDAVAALPERQRLAVAYHYLGGLPHAETAELIGGSTDAVRRAAADGIKSLRHAYHAAQQTKEAIR